MGRLVRVGPYYIPPPVPHCGGSGDLEPFPYLLRKYPGISPWSQWMTTDI